MTSHGGGGPLNTWAGFLWNNSVCSGEGGMWEYFSGAVSKSSVYKVCECLKRGCVGAWLGFCSGCVWVTFPSH